MAKSMTEGGSVDNETRDATSHALWHPEYDENSGRRNRQRGDILLQERSRDSSVLFARLNGRRWMGDMLG
jgi:hypothetical protein